MTEDFSNAEKDTITDIVKTVFRIESTDLEGPLIIYRISPDSFNQEKFNTLFQKLARLNLSLYNNGMLEILVTRKMSNKKMSRIKILLLLLTFLSISYVGATYSMTYYKEDSFPLQLALAMGYFVIPMILIIGSREIPKYIIRKKSGLEYSLPILIPNPILMGSMGIINAPGEPYKTHKDQVYSGFFSIIFGIVISIFFLSMGFLGVSVYTGTIEGPNSSISVVNLPLFFQATLGNFLPATGALDPMALAGWSGLLFTSFNAFPIGMLDGGSVFSGIRTSVQKNISYVFLTIMIVIDLTFPSWFILPIMVLLVGIDPQQPYESGITLMKRGNFFIIIITLLIMVVGAIPFPVHSALPSIETNAVVSSAVVMSGNSSYANFSIFVINNGQITVDPAFSSNISLPFSVKSTSGFISPSHSAIYYISMNVSKLPVGFTRIPFQVYINSNFNTVHFTVLKISNSSNVFVNVATYSSVNIGNQRKISFITFSTSTTNLSENVFISAPNGLQCNISYEGTGNQSAKLSLMGSQLFPVEFIASDNVLSILNFTIVFNSPLQYPVVVAIYNLTYNGSMLIIRN